jgi:hypothetical protein
MTNYHNFLAIADCIASGHVNTAQLFRRKLVFDMACADLIQALEENRPIEEIQEAFDRAWRASGDLLMYGDHELTSAPESCCHLCDKPFVQCECEPNMEWEGQFN